MNCSAVCGTPPPPHTAERTSTTPRTTASAVNREH